MMLVELFMNFFLKQTQKNFDPVEIGKQILIQVKKLLQSLIILLVASVIFCMLVGHLITRTLDLLDNGGFYFSNSVILLLILTVIDLIVIVYVLKKTTKEDQDQEKETPQPPRSSFSPIEGAIAALIIDFVKQREVNRKHDEDQSENK